MADVPMEDWISAAISEEQKRPFAGTRDRSSILAAAGSGKTRTLTPTCLPTICVQESLHRASWPSHSRGKRLRSFLHGFISCETRRCRQLSYRAIFIGTIHSWCLQYIYSQPDFYNITPIDELHL